MKILAELFPEKIIVTAFSLKIEFKEKAEGLSWCRRSKNTTGGFNFEI